MEESKLAKIEWDAENDLYIVTVETHGQRNLKFVAGTQLLEDLEKELKRVNAEMSA